MGYLDNTGLTRLWSKITSKLAGYVPITRKINGKPLDADIALTASDVGASTIDHTHDIGVTNLYVETQYFSGNNWNNLNQWEALDAGTAWSELSDDTWNELANSRWRDIVYRYKTIIPFKEYGRTGASHGIYQRINVQVGETFTFSFYAMGSNADAYIFFTDENSNDSCETSISEVHIGTLSSNIYKRYSGTTTVTKAGILYARVENAADTWMQVCGLKLEHGSIATDWSPNPDDNDINSDNLYNLLDNRYAKINDVDTLKTTQDQMASNLIASDNLKFKFGKDGDGNYGYYGADGSLIPFKSYYVIPYEVLSANLKNGTMVTGQYDNSYGFSCSGTVNSVTLTSYCGTKFTIDVTNYDTLYFAYRKQNNHGQLTARIYNENGSIESSLTNSYHTNSTTWAMFKMDLSTLKGNKTIVLHGGYVDSTGSSSSLSYFSCVYLSKGGTPPPSIWS